MNDAGPPRGCRVLIPFATPNLYGAERTIIEAFDLLRPEVLPKFVQAESVALGRAPVIEELERRGLPFELLRDGDGWPRIRPRKLRGNVAKTAAVLLAANRYYTRAVKDCSAVYVDGIYAAMFILGAALRCRLAGKKVIQHFHDWPVGPLPRVWSALLTDCFHNTVGGRDVVLRLNPRLRRQRHWITPPVTEVDTSIASPLPEPDAKHIVFAGQVSLHKGVDLLIDAFGRIASRHGDAVLHIVGGAQAEFLPAFRAMCAQSSAAKRIRYWGYQRQAARFFKGAYVSVQTTPPSRYLESFGRTVVEAMAFGVPSVSFGSGALSEILEDGKTGVICEESVEALAAGMERLLSAPRLRDECGCRALDAYRDRFAPGVTRAQWANAFAAIATRRTRQDGEPALLPDVERS